ncbi:putative killer toxin sensitivity protein [Erysiphe necator]|uniref:Elongator complex protein 5 n=1 Tax=Uncinula necator TaxID=52586 RepID=A0A0B1PC37_UNCNE|nr:putative killer toxin sensitivity protein [Erysiphe necator]
MSSSSTTFNKHKTTCNTLLFQKLLNLSAGVSPFTLILETLEQSGNSLIQEFGRRAKISNTKVVFVSFKTPYCKKAHLPIEISSFINARQKTICTLREEIISHLNLPKRNSVDEKCNFMLFFDSLVPLASSHSEELSSFLTSLLISSSVSLLAVYHVDIPIPCSITPYSPGPLVILTYLATAILTVSSLEQVLSRKRARDRSLPEPLFGLEEVKEGVIIGRNDSVKEKGLVVQMELRKRSGRGILENFVLIPSSSSKAIPKIIPLTEYPAYISTPTFINTENQDHSSQLDMTFNLSLSEKQKKERDEVVLPYFDAQKEGGNEGGRILYQMGTEDHEDFDEEEDEI